MYVFTLKVSFKHFFKNVPFLVILFPFYQNVLQKFRSKWDPSTWSFQKFSSLLCYLFYIHCYPNIIPCYQIYSKCYRKNKFLPCMKSVVWGWINVLKKYWRNVPFFLFVQIRPQTWDVRHVRSRPCPCPF